MSWARSCLNSSGPWQHSFCEKEHHMTNTTPHGRALAIAASASFTIGGLTILLGDVILKPAEWTSYHALTVLTVFGTVAAGHLMVDAARSRTLAGTAAAFGFLVLFLSGTGLVVYQSVGRQAENTETAVLSVEATNKALAEKGVELAQARQRLKDANDMVDKETAKKRCGPACADWKTRVTEVSANVKQIEAEIAKLGPAKPVAPKAEKMAAVAELFGADKAKAKAALTLAEPFLWTLFFEIGSIVSLGFAFRRIEVKTVAEQKWEPAEGDRRQTSFPLPHDLDELRQLTTVAVPRLGNSGNSGNGGGGGRKVFSRDEAEAELVTRLALGETVASQDDLAARWGVNKSTVSKWLRSWEREQLIPARQQIGRCKQLQTA